MKICLLNDGHEAMITNQPGSILGAGGLLSNAAPGSVIIDMSNAAPVTSREIYAACIAKGVSMLDAPFCESETSAIVVGGDRLTFDRVYDILLTIGTTAVYCGNSGAGNVVRLAGQIIVALKIAAITEAFTLSSRIGIAPDKVFKAFGGGLAGSAVLDTKIPKIINDDFTPGYKIDHHITDLRNALDTAHETGITLPFTALIMQIMQLLQADGLGQNDHSTVAKYYEKLTDTKIRM